jgi:hypothetical protein
MTAWWTALALIGCAAILLLMEQVVERATAAWVRAAAPQPGSVGDDDLELDLSELNSVPQIMRGFCPQPPFVALAYHRTCGSCRTMWAQIRQSDDLDQLHMVHSAEETDLLRRKGVLREPSIALPAGLMAMLPSGLLLRVEDDWRLAEVHLATSVAEVRQFLHATVVRS